MIYEDFILNVYRMDERPTGAIGLKDHSSFTVNVESSQFSTQHTKVDQADDDELRPIAFKTGGLSQFFGTQQVRFSGQCPT